MKKIILFLVTSLALNLTSCMNKNEKTETLNEKDNVQAQVEVVQRKELRGMWLSFYEISGICKGKSEEEYRDSAEKILAKLNENKFNTVFFQVRCFSDALYKSSVFPSSRYVVEKEGDALEFDPLEIFIAIAKKYNISVHAWINPLRISYTTDISSLSETNPAIKFYNEDEDLQSIIICEKGLFYNPADENARKVILSGIRELIENYALEGIQFDDYFYPDAEDINDAILFNQYKDGGGQLSLEEWRKNNVSSLISSVYSLVKSHNKNLVFGVSPSASFEYNEKIFADVKLWCKEDGFVDYIMPQIYFGFENENMPFSQTVDEWEKLEKTESVTLYCGLAPYKSGEVDENAGSGENEWVENDDILSRQYEYLKGKNSFSGFSLFSYSYCYDENATENSTKELGVLTSMLQ